MNSFGWIFTNFTSEWISEWIFTSVCITCLRTWQLCKFMQIWWNRAWSFLWFYSQINISSTCICLLYYCLFCPMKQLQRWLYWREHLKYVWNVYCVATNHRWDLHTTETTGNDSFRSVMEQIIFVLFKDTNYLIRNLKHRCSPRSVPRTASSTSFDFRKKSFRSQRDATATSFPCNDISWSHEDNKKWTIVMFSFLIA